MTLIFSNGNELHEFSLVWDSAWAALGIAAENPQPVVAIARRPGEDLQRKARAAGNAPITIVAENIID
ncbi:hypothetical protein HYN43_016675 [Mucilaginibacter celer]|uniref:Uncharacterized protein n=1 Tax=Mucilaginibacter celer TaxID=2305508 RepID=A0A494W059_9SPHI|nr:hypothetical protein HYN43_016675 [Mucilaginibacter celer]